MLCNDFISTNQSRNQARNASAGQNGVLGAAELRKLLVKVHSGPEIEAGAGDETHMAGIIEQRGNSILLAVKDTLNPHIDVCKHRSANHLFLHHLLAFCFPAQGTWSSVEVS